MRTQTPTTMKIKPKSKNLARLAQQITHKEGAKNRRIARRVARTNKREVIEINFNLGTV